MLDKVIKLTENEISFDEGMHVYKMNTGDDSTFDVKKVNWQTKERNDMFFIDDDEDPFNGEMTLFRKTKFNKFEISSITCKVPSNNGLPTIGKEEDEFNVSVIKEGGIISSEQLSPQANCIVKPFDQKTEL